MKTLVHVDNEQIESVLKQCSICFVGMADTDGTPYVIPMNFGYKDGTLYLHSAQEGRSISILNRNPRVCISFCPTTELAYQNVEVACSYRMRASSVILMKQYTDRPFTYGRPAVLNVKIWRVDIDEISCKEFGAPYRKAVGK